MLRSCALPARALVPCPSHRARCRRPASVPRDSAESEPWWTHLEAVYLPTFDAGTADEALYTTESADGAGTLIAFADEQACARLAADVATVLGKPGSAVGVPPLALLLLARETRLTVSVVPPGYPFDAPKTIRLDPASPEPPSQDLATRLAQQRAAEAVRRALLAPLRSVRRAVCTAATPERGALPPAAAAVAIALRALGRRRLEALLPGESPLEALLPADEPPPQE